MKGQFFSNIDQQTTENVYFNIFKRDFDCMKLLEGTVQTIIIVYENKRKKFFKKALFLDSI